MIPKIIFQFWDSFPEMPVEFKIFQNYHESIFPDYELITWNEKKGHHFIKTFYPWFLKTYEEYDKPIKKYDALRYFFLYHFGGIYMDMDSIFLHRPNKLFSSSGDNLILGFQRFNTNAWDAIGNSFIASPPRHPFLEYIIHRLPKTKHLPVLMATGPLFLTHYTKRFRQNIIVLEMPILYGLEWHDKKKKGMLQKKIADIQQNPSILFHYIKLWQSEFPSSIVMTFWKGSWKKSHSSSSLSNK